jgi:hypothetical protein
MLVTASAELRAAGKALVRHCDARQHQSDDRQVIRFHVPAGESGGRVDEGNFAVWALKRKATDKQARDDFSKLDRMFAELRYPVGIFINIDAADHFAASYTGRFPGRLRTVAVRLTGDQIIRDWGSPE